MRSAREGGFKREFGASTRQETALGRGAEDMSTVEVVKSVKA